MTKIDDKIISLDVFKKHFVCDLHLCKGACCVEGDAGAPLTKNEKTTLEEIYQTLKPFLRKEGVAAIEKHGVSVYDDEGDLTTPLVNNRECAFVIYENGISKCAIEKAFLAGKTDFRKPLSCHLFPIRIKEYSSFEAVNYENIEICKPACECGSKLKVPVYKFLKVPLIRKYGLDWYNKLLEASKLL